MIAVVVVLLVISSVQDYFKSEVSNKIVLILSVVAMYDFLTTSSVNLFDVMSSAMLVLLIFVPGMIRNCFGAADIKILLLISLVFPYEQVLLILVFSLLCFIIYWLLFARGQKEAPFVPSILVGVVASVWVV